MFYTIATPLDTVCFIIMNASFPPHNPWPKAIILVDMNAFFCSVEQLDNPELQGHPIGITNGSQGTCIITCSYEARDFGIRTGMRLGEAQSLCPDFIRIPSNPRRYAEVSSNIMDALTMLTPDMEVFSVDEAFLDITHCQKLMGPPEHIAKMVKQTVLEASGGILCSIGLSGDKTTAKYAAKLNKPDGLTIIPPWESRTALATAQVTELCGIAKGIGGFLADRGVHTCGDMQNFPIGELGKRFGNMGRRIWLMAQGLDPDPVKVSVPAPKSIGHGKVMPPNTTDTGIIQTFMLHMAEKVAARLRRHQFLAGRFFIGLHSANGWISSKYRPALPTDHGPDIMDLCYIFMDQEWHGEAVSQVQITALDPRPGNEQLEMFVPDRKRMNSLNRARDEINQRYGEFALAPARLLLRSSMPNVIAPAWKPSGHRETIL